MYSVLFVVACFSASCIFLRCLSYFSRFAAEAGTKGDICFLDAPDARTAASGSVYLDFSPIEGYFLCTSF